MSLFDELPNGAQVKCWWNDCRRVKRGDEVPDIDGLCSYQIALREGGYAQVQGGHFTYISKKPRLRAPIYDKYGEPMPAMSEGYLLEDWENDPIVKAARAMAVGIRDQDIATDLGPVLDGMQEK